MNPDEIILTAILGLAALVWALMEGVGKPMIYKIVAWLNALERVNIKDEHKPAIVRVVAAVIGIAFVWGVDSLSFAAMWGIIIPENWLWLDIASTGIVVSLGNKGIHWLIDLIRDNGELIKLLLQNKANSPTMTVELELGDTLPTVEDISKEISNVARTNA